MRIGPSRFIVTLLLLTAWVAPGLPWLAAHAVLHHDHGAADDGAEKNGAAPCHEGKEAVQALLHGHPHPDGVPRHGHELVTAAPARHESVPELRAAVPGLPSDPLPAPKTAVAWAAHSADPPGADPPPLLHLLCILLI
ncbi:MAG TPA: hypothetical protein VJ725_16055 [Thermoanaerobaculia bacterium]|nr:hypothetical protein [Thermoanaerobaculia bacterium]